MGIFIDNYLQGNDSFGIIQIIHGQAVMKIVLFFQSSSTRCLALESKQLIPTDDPRRARKDCLNVREILRQTV